MRTTAMLIANHEAKVVEFEDTIEELYKLINCETIDMVERMIKGTRYVFILDDEGKICKEPKEPSAYATDYPEVIVGNIIISKGEDKDGYLMPITIEDATKIANAMEKGILFYEARN
jgi:hypothetical protein